jgi:hypothetical protein
MKIVSLKDEVEQLKAMIVSGRSTVDGQQSTAISSALLEQNTPNPFDKSSIIHFDIPSSAANARIVVTDASGKTIKQFSNLIERKWSHNH